NIVIGGLSGAMPPALGWAAVADAVPAGAWLLVLIIFIWTPPHFWALALYRNNDYKRAGLPMLPVTHGQQFTRLHILLYSVALFAASILPFIVRMSGLLYLASAIVLSGLFVWRSWQLYREYSDERSRGLFRYSIVYLALLFAALLVDHWIALLCALERGKKRGTRRCLMKRPLLREGKRRSRERAIWVRGAGTQWRSFEMRFRYPRARLVQAAAIWFPISRTKKQQNDSESGAHMGHLTSRKSDPQKQERLS